LLPTRRTLPPPKKVRTLHVPLLNFSVTIRFNDPSGSSRKTENHVALKVILFKFHR
jgi:hypothetical protein